MTEPMKQMAQIVGLMRPPLWCKKLPLCVALFLLASAGVTAQVPGIPPAPPDIPSPSPATDSTFIFTPARPLIDSNALRTMLDDAFGMNLLFSSSGYGLGFFYERKLGTSFSTFLDIGISGARKGDELEVFNRDPSSIYYLSFYVPNKINRVWHVPIVLGAKQEVFSGAIFNNFRPYVNGGVGGTVIVTTPYDKEFFNAFGDAELHTAFGGFIGVGAEVSEKSPGIGFNARYYYLPKTPGIESVYEEPITNFGGLFLTLNIPF